MERNQWLVIRSRKWLTFDAASLAYGVEFGFQSNGALSAMVTAPAFLHLSTFRETDKVEHASKLTHGTFKTKV